MGTKLTITKDDVNSSKLLKPGWFDCVVDKYEESPASQTSKNPGSLNRNLGFRVAAGDDEGVRLRTTFNEVFAPLLNQFVTAVGGEFTEGKTYDLEDSVGKNIKVHVKRGEYNGRPTNEVDGFRTV
jgi:hypothetical protein